MDSRSLILEEIENLLELALLRQGQGRPMDERVGEFASIFECDPLDIPFSLRMLHELDQVDVHEDHRTDLICSLERLIEMEDRDEIG